MQEVKIVEDHSDGEHDTEPAVVVSESDSNVQYVEQKVKYLPNVTLNISASQFEISVTGPDVGVNAGIVQALTREFKPSQKQAKKERGCEVS